MSVSITPGKTGLPDLSPHDARQHPALLATIARVTEACHLGHAAIPEDYTWIVLLDDDTCRAEIDDLGWSRDIDGPGLAARTRAFALVSTTQPEKLLIGGVPPDYKAFFTRRRMIVVNSGASGTLCTIVGAVPLVDPARPPGYLFVDYQGQLHFSADLNAVTVV